ncbi:hypothetical protein TBCH5v1_2160 [Thermococcus barophilus]|uniref:Uncharacterized protein n=2 Tax=Thermococcus barophilus TaxID=55802 RepID=A0A0S1XE49_THEBA|nr:hypothetical protein TBCH5v1_2160 [Thermococcus barophilus]
MYLTHKSYSQLTLVDKEIAREELARKVLKWYFSNWTWGYFKLLKELDDFYDKFEKAGRDKVTFVRFIRSLCVEELKRVFNSEPEILYSAILWLKRHRGRAQKNVTFSQFYSKVEVAVSELSKDKWTKKLVKAVLSLGKQVEIISGERMGRKEFGFYDYYALFILQKSHVALATAFTAAVLTTRHIIAHYFFDPKLNYRQRIVRIREHFKPLFEFYPEAAILLDDYFTRSVIETMTHTDIVRFTGADDEKLEQYYRRNRHRFSRKTREKLIRALTYLALLDYDIKKKFWQEHNLGLYSLTALVEWERI